MIVDFWHPEDERVICLMLMSFLQDTFIEGYDFKPTENNVARFWDIGINASLAGDPVLVMLDPNPIAFCLWVGHTAHDFDVRSNACISMGTYVVPERRREHIGKTIREAAHLVAKKRGYTRIDGFGYYEAPKKLMESNGWKQVACLYQKEL